MINIGVRMEFSSRGKKSDQQDKAEIEKAFPEITPPAYKTTAGVP